ncbi:unnamed protein product [Alternaria alternata]
MSSSSGPYPRLLSPTARQGSACQQARLARLKATRRTLVVLVAATVDLPAIRTDRPGSLFAPYGLPSRPRGPRRPYSPPIEDVALRRRRDVYRRKLYSMHVGSNRFSGYSDISPRLIANSPELQSKARAWIRRELRVFTYLHTESEASSSDAVTTSSNAEFLLSYIVSILKMVDLRASSGHAENLLAEYLGRENSKLFLHELNNWLRSPFTKVEVWDREVQYQEDLEQD